MTRYKTQLAVTAAAVALALGFSTVSAAAFNDGAAVTIESLQDRLLELRDQANNIQARADAEHRELTEDEQTEVAKIFDAFEVTEADIERRQKLEGINSKMAAPAGRRSEADGAAANPQAAANPNASRAQIDGATRRASAPAQPRSADTGKWGFRSAGEYFMAVVKGSQKAATPDPRLIANAPTSYGSEGVGADGGFAVPPDFRTEIVKRVMGEDSLLSRTDQMTTSSNSITVPTDETTPWQSSGGIQAYWEAEAGQHTQSKPKLTEKTVKACKIITLVPMTDELLQDAPSMAAYVNSKAPEKIDFRVNDAIVNGDGIGKPLGFLQSGALITVAGEGGQSADTVVFNNIVNMYTRATEQTQRTGVWLVNSDVMAQLMTMQFPGTGTAVPVYLPPGGLSAQPYGTLMGRPVIPTEAAAALGDVGDISFVDLKQYMSVVKAGGLRQDVSIHLFFDYDITAFRFVLRVGGQPWWNAPITRNKGTSRSPFVTLAAR
jgi:HK97 family phage major capsid protein